MRNIIHALLIGSASADMLKTACYEYGTPSIVWDGFLLPENELKKYTDCGQEICPQLCPSYDYKGKKWFGKKPVFFEYPLNDCGLTDKCIEYKVQTIPTIPNRSSLKDVEDEDEGLDCVYGDDGTKICIDTDAAVAAATDALADAFGFGSSTEEPKKEEPAPLPKIANGVSCVGEPDSRCESTCCSANHLIEMPESIKTYVNFDNKRTTDWSTLEIALNELKQKEIMQTWTYWAAPPNLTAEAEAAEAKGDSDELSATDLLS